LGAWEILPTVQQIGLVVRQHKAAHEFVGSRTILNNGFLSGWSARDRHRSHHTQRIAGPRGVTELNPQVPYRDGRIHPALSLRILRLQQNVTNYNNYPFAAPLGCTSSTFIPISSLAFALAARIFRGQLAKAP
jgi:hypothetical protein